MPYHKDFSTLFAKGELKVQPEGWKSLEVEYGYEYIGPIPNFFWRIKGTQHTFRIGVAELNQISKGDYANHVKEFLENFRKDYLGWATEGFPTEWMREYHYEYRNYMYLI